MFVAALMLVSVQAIADQQAAVPQPVTAPTAAAPKKEKKICRVDDADSGSHMVKRICLTAEEWQNRGGKGMMTSSHSGLSGQATSY